MRLKSCYFIFKVAEKLLFFYENFKLEKEPTDKAKEPDPGESDQQNLGYKQLKNRKADRTVGLNYCISNNYFKFVTHGLTSSGNEQLKKKRYSLNNQNKR